MVPPLRTKRIIETTTEERKETIAKVFKTISVSNAVFRKWRAHALTRQKAAHFSSAWSEQK